LVSKVDLAIIGVAIVGLFFVIRGAGQALGNIKLPFSEGFGDIKFPDFSQVGGDISQGFTDAFGSTQDFFSDLQKQFTDFFNAQDTGASSIAGETVPSEPGSDVPVTIPEDTIVNPDGTVSSSTPPTIDLGVSPGSLDPTGEISFNQLKSQVFNTLTQTLNFTPSRAFEALKNINFVEGEGLFPLKRFLETVNQPIDPGLLQQSAPAAQAPAISDQPIQNFLNQSGQTFLGGGQGFIGGSITETPLQNLSLSSLVDKFGITASQAANLKAISANDFGGFDFGSNTGLGIGSIFKNPNLENILPSPSSNVSNPSFVGLSNTQIALQLTGGNIQNFA